MASTESVSHSSSTSHKSSFALLAIGAIGVVFGDIGTSPLYAFREALNQAAPTGIGAAEIMGVLSLALWSLILVVTVKYVLFLMRADNEGEGGVLALLALAGRAIGGRKGVILVLGAAGAALFYGDAIITPALSVLSAVEGLKTVPGLGARIDEHLILQITVVILIALFAVQSRGTASVAKLFGPICVVWFVALAALGLMHISDEPAILGALSPHHAVKFLLTHGMIGLLVLGAVFLTVTGAEALTADMGHFGRLPIQAGWFALVFPALALNYFGQGAFALAALEKAQAAGVPFVNQDWFFLMAPEAFRVPLVILAGLATIIASQAVITGAYSLTQQAIQLGLLPRLRILQTSGSHAGQIYLPLVNIALALGSIFVVLQFRSSNNLAAAYGIAVTGTMLVTTLVFFRVTRLRWQWAWWKIIPLALFFLVIETAFLGSNLHKFSDGGWLPILVGLALLAVMHTWKSGKTEIFRRIYANEITESELSNIACSEHLTRVRGTGVFMAGNPTGTPLVLLHHVKANKVLHETVVLLSVTTEEVPMVDEPDRFTVREIGNGVWRAIGRYGYMESPDVASLMEKVRDAGVPLKLNEATYFFNREMIITGGDTPMFEWQKHFYSFLSRNARQARDYYQLPPMQIIEVGLPIQL